MVLHQYDYIFAIGTIFAFLDAWNIGANDVANSFATSVSSRSLTMKQAMAIATCCEFAGSMAVGARVAETIRTKIISTKLFEKDPAVLMLAMMCAVIGSSIYLTVATRLGLPVSTTHSIMGGVIGVGIAAVGAGGVNWGWSGVSQVFAAWAIAPGIAGAFGAIIFLITKFGVMERRNPVKKAFISVPFYFFVTSALLTMLIVWKGGSSKIKLTDAETAGVIVGVGACVALLIVLFFLPFLWRKIIHNDWELQWYHIFMGPLLLRRGTPPPQPEGHNNGIQDYYRGYATREELDAQRAAGAAPSNPADVEKHGEHVSSSKTDASSDDEGRAVATVAQPKHTGAWADLNESVSARPEGTWKNPAVFWWLTKRIIFRGVEKDVVSAQKKRNVLSGNVEEMHAAAAHYDNQAEYMYSFLQVMTAATSSFTHGANDVSNAIGPYATIYLIWQTNKVSSNVPVPDWILAFGGAAIVIGLWTYGYNIMRNLGNRITLHSPSRGFSMELGSAVTVVLATRLKLPVSTTQCITGATVGVGLCAGTWRTINWRMVLWIYAGWFITLPCAGIISGCLMGIILNAPQWGNSL